MLPTSGFWAPETIAPGVHLHTGSTFSLQKGRYSLSIAQIL